jgi:methyltransferase
VGGVTLSAVLFTVLVLATGGERIVELIVSRRHAAWAFARGGVESARRQMPWMVALHVGLLLGALAEVWLLGRPFVPALGWPALAIALACQGARWWIIATLGPRWNTRVIVVPGMPAVATGPYRIGWLRHPNYLVVAIEGIALPLVHTAWITAVAFTVLNAVLLLGFRIPAEDRVLRSAEVGPPGADADEASTAGAGGPGSAAGSR